MRAAIAVRSTGSAEQSEQAKAARLVSRVRCGMQCAALRKALRLLPPCVPVGCGVGQTCGLCRCLGVKSSKSVGLLCKLVPGAVQLVR